MSIETLLSELTGAINELSSKLDGVLGKAASVSASDEAEDKPKRTRKSSKTEETKGDDADADGEKALTHDQVKKAAGEWLGEFAKDESDPETNERKKKIKAALAKLAGKEGATIAEIKSEDLHRVIAWIEKQKAADNGFGAGRLTEKPGAGSSASDDDDI